jgi:hypothetical protein
MASRKQRTARERYEASQARARSQAQNAQNQARASASPIAPQNPYVAPTPPVDPDYEAYRVSANRNVALADADAGYQNARIENQYGLGSDRSNPWSDAKMLEDSYLRDQRGTTNSYASQGQLNSGAYQRMQGENKRSYSIGYDRLARDYQDAKYGVARDQLQTWADSGVGIDQAKFESILRSLMPR